MEPVILSAAKNLIKEKNMNCAQDIEYMQRAMTLAENGRGFVNPNPLVGAVIVMDGRVIGEGWHRKYGCLHAEREALAACTEDPAGSTMYVTLEPCCHYGKQPPCTEAIIAAGISRVVVGLPSGTPDPSRLAALADAGVETVKVAGDGLKDNGPKGDGLEQDYMRRETDDIRKVDIDALLSCLGKMGIDSVLVEGGAELDWSMIESGLVDEVYCYIAF